MEEIPEAEVDLNRLLYWHVLRASRQLYPQDPVAPTLEANNQPDPDDQARSNREHKRPDLQWIYLDRYEDDPVRSSKQFVVECKRLGAPKPAAWILNVNYVENGVVRFVDPQWAYAKRFGSAAMVGYWQTMNGDDVVREVNSAATVRKLPALNLHGAGCQERGVTYLVQQLKRTFPVTSFLLHHLWVDIRASPPTAGPVSPVAE